MSDTSAVKLKAVEQFSPLVTQSNNRGGVIYRAGFGKGGVNSEFRFTLSRHWGGIVTPNLFSDGARAGRSYLSALFIMLNPSTADAMQDDPTVAKCMRLARAWGFGSLEVRNLFAWRSTWPDGIKSAHLSGKEPTGGIENDLAIVSAVRSPLTGIIVAAWGNYGKFKERSTAARKFLADALVPVVCFKVSGQGEPEHPLYQREDVTPENGMLVWP